MSPDTYPFLLLLFHIVVIYATIYILRRMKFARQQKDIPMTNSMDGIKGNTQDDLIEFFEEKSAINANANSQSAFKRDSWLRKLLTTVKDEMSTESEMMNSSLRTRVVRFSDITSIRIVPSHPPETIPNLESVKLESVLNVELRSVLTECCREDVQRSQQYMN